jgi:hypothetical protein
MGHGRGRDEIWKISREVFVSPSRAFGSRPAGVPGRLVHVSIYYIETSGDQNPPRPPQPTRPRPPTLPQAARIIIFRLYRYALNTFDFDAGSLRVFGPA